LHGPVKEGNMPVVMRKSHIQLYLHDCRLLTCFRWMKSDDFKIHTYLKILINVARDGLLGTNDKH
jgi:hypothetical protein